MQKKFDSVEECEAVWKAGEIPLMVDTEGAVLKKIQTCSTDRCKFLQKKNLGNHQRDGRSTVGLGTGDLWQVRMWIM